MYKSTINGRYEVLERIGSGGMADVFLCFDTVLKREVAVKRLRGDLSHDPVALLRFQREANASSGLHHPNIVEVYDVGDDEGQPYIVMEMMRGITAKELIHRRGALEKYEALSIMEQLVSAVCCAHQAGIIHRDIKPQNVLVNDDGTVKITDFGIALANDALQLTKSDSVMGSVHYLAPECVRGDGATKQSDIYAMGIIFYELLAGDVPYHGETSIEVAMKQLRDPMPLVLNHNSQLPHSFANIIAKSTQKNKLNRYTSAEAMLEDLKTSLSERRIREPLWSLEVQSEDGTKMIPTLNGLDSDTQENVAIDPKKARKKWYWIGGGVSVVLILALVFAFLSQKPNAPYYLDDISGLTVEEATELLKDNNIHIYSTLSYDYSEEYESGKIISTRPQAGTEIDKGSQIRVTVSKGKLFKIEDYTGKKFDDIKQLFAENTNVTVTRKNQNSTTVEKGIIISQEGLTLNQLINPDQKYEIILYVSSELEMLMPDFRNGDIMEAKAALEKEGAIVELEELSFEGMSEEKLNSLSYGVVIKQSPFPNSYYVQHEGSKIILSYYNEAKRPTPQTGEESNGSN